MRWDYGAKIGKTPFNYSLAYEHGAWEQDGRHSIHTYYYAKLGIDPIRLALGMFIQALTTPLSMKPMTTAESVVWVTMLLP